tara:strand:- start:122 stop:379 length:258 start_codon:yes stop_codon:yes gene_type:complete
MNRTKTVKPKVVELSSEDKAKQRKKLMAEFLAKGGKVEKVPYGVTNQEMGSPNQNAGWIPPQTITPKTWRTRKTKAKAKKKKPKK